MEGQRTFVCMLCMHRYAEAEGDSESGHLPGTLWEDLPAAWRCPRCGAAKGYFEDGALFSQRDPGAFDASGGAGNTKPPSEAEEP